MIIWDLSGLPISAIKATLSPGVNAVVLGLQVTATAPMAEAASEMMSSVSPASLNDTCRAPLVTVGRKWEALNIESFMNLTDLATANTPDANAYSQRDRTLQVS